MDDAQRMRNAEEEAAEKIAGILGIQTESEETNNIALAENAGVMCMAKEEAPEPRFAIEEISRQEQLDAGKVRLGIYNRAIKALGELQEDDEVCKARMCAKLNEIEQAIRLLRIRIFEPMIDWDAMASQKQEEA